MPSSGVVGRGGRAAFECMVCESYGNHGTDGNHELLLDPIHRILPNDPMDLTRRIGLPLLIFLTI